MLYGPSNTLHISGWNFNCGVASIGHVLDEQLSLATLPCFFSHKPYQTLLNAFRVIYQDATLGWLDIKQFINKFPHPGDKGAIWSLPLRHCLQRSVTANRKYQRELFVEFHAVVSAIVEGEALSEYVDDYSNIIKSNQVYFDNLIVQIHSNNTPAAPKHRLDNPRILRKYWDNTGYEKYAEFINKGIKGETPMITSTELSVLCQFLRIKLEIYGPEQGSTRIDYSAIQQQTLGYTGIRSPAGVLVVSNPGRHWQRLISDIDAARRHNYLFDNTYSILLAIRDPALILHKILNDNKNRDTLTINDVDTTPLIEMDTPVSSFENETTNEDNDSSDKRPNEALSLPFYIEDRKVLGNLLDHYIEAPIERNHLLSKARATALTCMQWLGYRKSDTKTREVFEQAQESIRTANYSRLSELIKQEKNIVKAIDQYGNTLLHHSFLMLSKSRQLLLNFTCNFEKLSRDEDCVPLIIKLKEELKTIFSFENTNISIEGINACIEALSEVAIDKISLMYINQDIQVFWSMRQNLEQFYKAGDFPQFESLIEIAARKIVTALLKAGADVNVKNNQSATPLHFSALYGYSKINQSAKEDLTGLLLDHGALISTDANGLTPLHFAATNNIVATRILLQKVTHIDHVSTHGLTALHLAALTNQIDIFKLLLEHKASPYAKAYPQALEILGYHYLPAEQSTPLGFAFESVNTGIINIAVKYQLDNKLHQGLAHLSTSSKMTLLHYFASKGDVSTFNALLKVGCDIQKADASGYQPLHVASMFGHIDIVSVILDYHKSRKLQFRFHKFNIDEKTIDGKTAWFLANEHQHQEVTALLKASGAKELKAPDMSKSILQRAGSFIMNQRKFTAELQSTTIYTNCNRIRVGLSVLRTAGGGPVAIGIQAIKQLSHYYPQVFTYAGNKVYYAAKPLVHNNAHWVVESGLDSTASVLSTTLNTSLFILRGIDYVASPMRYGVGTASSYLSANITAAFTDNKDAQAFAHFAGREVGYFIVDALTDYSPIFGETKFDPELNKGLTIWSSLLGRHYGESFVNKLHTVSDLQSQMYQNVGWLEHMAMDLCAEQLASINALLTDLPSYQEFQSALNSSTQLLMPYQQYTMSGTAFIGSVFSIPDMVGQFRDKLLLDLEQSIYSILPDCNYTRYASLYLNQTRSLLLDQKLKAALSDKEAAEKQRQNALAELERYQKEEAILHENPATTEFELKGVQQKISDAIQISEYAEQVYTESNEYYTDIQSQVTQQEATTNTAWLQTPKGQAQMALSEAQKNALDARIAFEQAGLKLDLLIKQGITAGRDFNKSQEDLLETANLLEKCQQVVVEKEQIFLGTATSLEHTAYEKDEAERQTKLEKSITEWKDNNIAIENHKDVLIEADNNVYSTKNELNLAEYEYKLVLYEYEDNAKKILALEHMVSFDIAGHVQHAVETYADDADIRYYLILQFSLTGMVSFDVAKSRLEDTLKTAQKSHHFNHRKEDLKNGLVFQWGKLEKDYLPSLRSYQEVLAAKLENREKEYNKIYQKHVNAQLNSELAKDNLLNLLAVEDREVYEINYQESKALQANEFWKSTHPSENVQTLLSILGQPLHAFQISHHEPRLLNADANRIYGSSVVAGWLIDYKYLFLPETSLPQRQAEKEAFAKEIEAQGLTESRIGELKLKMDEEIATQLFKTATAQNISKEISAEQHAQNAYNMITAPIQRGIDFAYSVKSADIKSGNTVLCEGMKEALISNNEAAAINIISQSLNQAVSSLSLNLVGEIKPTPAPTLPEIPPYKKHHHNNWIKIGGVALDIGGAILANGLTFIYDGFKLAGGLDKEHMFTLFSNKPMQPTPIPEYKPPKNPNIVPMPSSMTNGQINMDLSNSFDNPLMLTNPFSQAGILPLSSSVIPLQITVGNSSPAISNNRALETYHSSEPVLDPNIYSSFMGSTSQPLIFSLPIGGSAKVGVKPMGILAEESERITEQPLNVPEPKKPTSPNTASVKPINTNAPTESSVAEELRLLLPEIKRPGGIDALDLVLTAYQGSDFNVSEQRLDDDTQKITQSTEGFSLYVSEEDYDSFMPAPNGAKYEYSPETLTSREHSESLKERWNSTYDSIDNYSLAATIPYHDNILLNDYFALCRGIGGSIDATKYLILHPTSMLENYDDLSPINVIEQNRLRTEAIMTTFNNFIEGDSRIRQQIAFETLGGLVGLKFMTGTLKVGTFATTKVIEKTGKFLATNEFRTPITFMFDTNKLYCGPPLDALKFRNPIIKKELIWSKKSRLNAAMLPNKGKIRFVPPKDYYPSKPLYRGQNNGYMDRFDNEWTKGPSRTPGQPFEWDIQLSDLGKKQLGWASRDGNHVNVSLDGRITHR